MDRQELLRVDGAAFIDRVADDVEDAAEDFRADRSPNRHLGVAHRHDRGRDRRWCPWRCSARCAARRGAAQPRWSGSRPRDRWRVWTPAAPCKISAACPSGSRRRRPMTQCDHQLRIRFAVVHPESLSTISSQSLERRCLTNRVLKGAPPMIFQCLSAHLRWRAWRARVVLQRPGGQSFPGVA